MKFLEMGLKGAYVIELEKQIDERGFFARSWDKNEFEKIGLNPKIVQCNISSNLKKGTIRGLHYQVAPYEEAKLVVCTKGKIFDVLVDLRKDSQTFLRWESVELDDKDHKIIFIPEGFAHGFQTLEDNTEVFYQMSEYYHPECARGLRWDDAKFNIRWPISNPIVSEKDRLYPLFK